MKSAVETLSPTRIRLTVEVPFEELKPNLDSAYREIAKQIAIPGFRKGKVPPALIDHRVGREAVLGQAVNEAVPQLYANALQENEVEPLGQPELNLDEMNDGEDLKFTAEVDVKPEITLPDYTGLEVSVDDVAVTDEDVEQQLQSLRERFGTLQAVERAAEDGDHITIDLSASKDGEPIEEAQASGMNYRVGSADLLDGLDDAVRGKSADDEATFSTTLAGGEYAGQDVDVHVTVIGVKEQDLPDLDDEFAQLASEFDTLDELRADLREQELRRARLEQAQEARDAVLEKLMELVDVPLPEKALAEEIEARRNSILQQLGQIGMTVEQYAETQEQSEEEFNADLDKRATDAMKAQFLLDDVAKGEEVSVSQEELTQVIVERARESNMSPQDYMQQVMNNNQVSLFVRDVARSKALATIVDRATVTDESGNHVELNRLQPDGTIADDEDDAADEDSDATAATDDAAATLDTGDTDTGDTEDAR